MLNQDCCRELLAPGWSDIVWSRCHGTFEEVSVCSGFLTMWQVIGSPALQDRSGHCSLLCWLFVCCIFLHSFTSASLCLDIWFYVCCFFPNLLTPKMCKIRFHLTSDSVFPGEESDDSHCCPSVHVIFSDFFQGLFFIFGLFFFNFNTDHCDWCYFYPSSQ